MRILHLSDLHYNLHWFDWIKTQPENYDVLVIAGDLLDMFARVPLPQQAREVRRRLKGLPKTTVVCTGNHDVWPSHPLAPTDVMADGNWLQLCKREGLVVDGQSLDFGGERIEAVKWPIADWSPDTTVLVLHCPPADSPVGVPAQKADRASIMLTERLATHAPKLVLGGHIHQADSWICNVHGALCFNPGYSLDERVPNRVLIDTRAGIARWHSDWTTSECELASVRKA